MTVAKPSNGLKNDNLQKSATTNTNTVQVSYMGAVYTPKDKQPKFLQREDGRDDHDDDDFSDKFTPENVSQLQPVTK